MALTSCYDDVTTLFLFSTFIVNIVSSNILPDLPLEHYQYYLRNNPNKLNTCQDDDRCKNVQLTESIVNSSCWGYEDDCNKGHRYGVPGK